MKYETEISELIDIAFPKKEWMSDQEYNDGVEKSFKLIGISKQKLSDEIETGVKNGYTADQQVKIISELFSSVI